jgi:GTPase SAR1 family protein
LITSKDDSKNFILKINKIISYLNGLDPKNVNKMDYGPSQLAKNKIFGPKVMTMKRDLILLYIGKHVPIFSAEKEKGVKEINGIVYFTTYSLRKIANYRGFQPYPIDYQYYHTKDRYLKYKGEGLVIHKKMKGINLFALTKKGEQRCNWIIDELAPQVPDKVYKDSKNARSQPKIISLQSNFDQIQKDYGLKWLAKDYFETYKSNLDDWRKGFSFGLPSIKSRQELRREGLIGDIKTRLENEKKILIIGQSGSSKSTILMELICDYFDAGYEILYNEGMSELSNPDGLVNFIESRLKMNEKILVAVDDAHNDRTNSIFYVVDKLSNSNLTKDLRFIITARLPEFRWLLDQLDKVQEELRKSIRKLTGDEEKFIYHLPYFTKREIRDFIKKYLENIDNGEADEKSREVFDSTRGDPIMIKYNVLGQGLEQDVEEMSYRYLEPPQEMKTMLICSLLDVSNIPVTDRMLKQCGVLESAYHLNGSILNRNAEGLWTTKHPRWDQALFSFLYGSNNTRTLQPNRRKQDLKDSLVAIYKMREEKVVYSAISSLVYMVRQNLVPLELFIIVFKESISRRPLSLSNEMVSSVFVKISGCYSALEDYQSELDSLSEALTWNPDNVGAHMSKGTALIELARNDEAVESLDKALDIDVGLAKTWDYLIARGRALYLSGRRKEALACYDKVLEIDAYDQAAYECLGACFYEMEEYEKVIECCDKVLSMTPPLNYLN